MTRYIEATLYGAHYHWILLAKKWHWTFFCRAIDWKTSWTHSSEGWKCQWDLDFAIAIWSIRLTSKHRFPIGMVVKCFASMRRQQTQAHCYSPWWPLCRNRTRLAMFAARTRRDKHILLPRGGKTWKHSETTGETNCRQRKLEIKGVSLAIELIEPKTSPESSMDRKMQCR